MNTDQKHINDGEYAGILRMPEWQRIRKLIMRRDGGKCVNCGSKKSLNVHHKQYHADMSSGKLLEPWKYKLKYLVTLCRTCHSLGHAKYQVKTFKIKT